MAKKSASKAPAKKAPAGRDKKSKITIEILDMNPKNCIYRNPPNMRYVEARQVKDGKTYKKGLMLLGNDHIARLNA